LLCGAKDILGDAFFKHNTLNNPAAVTQTDEYQLAFLSFAGHPAGQCDYLAIVPGNLGDRSAR